MSQKRLLSLCMALIALLGVVLCRVFWIGSDTAYAQSAGTQILSDTELPRRRGDFYDRNGVPLTGVVRRWYALCIPGDGSYARLFPYVTYADQASLYRNRNAISPFLLEVNADLSGEGIYCYQGAQRYLPIPVARHLLGYLDGDGRGVAGLELAYDDLLARFGDEQAVRCATTAQGSLLTGFSPQLRTLQDGTGQGVRLTLDIAVQRAAEGIALQMMPRGCILVLKTDSAQVLASVSMPEFDPEDVASSIQADDTSLINRPLAAFSAGSVFKMALAIAAYREGLDWYTHDCQGSVEVAGQTYRCALGRAHGMVNLRGALKVSCNCFFVQLGLALGAQKLARIAADLGFGSGQVVAPGLKSAAGTLPTVQQLANPGQLAMLSFGQGELTVTPLQIAALTNAIAGDGILRTPSFVQGTVTGRPLRLCQAASVPEGRRVCEASLARVLRSMLCTVVEDGIGGEARPREGGAGGKTGTAQTGQYDADGQELLNHWFAGFWPAEKPQYTIVVLQDGMVEPRYSSAEIFARMANALLAMQGGVPQA